MADAFLCFSLPDDKNLPSVPPLQLSIPADYPDQSPQWADDGQVYGKTHWLSLYPYSTMEPVLVKLTLL